MFWIIWCVLFCIFDTIMSIGNFYFGHIGLGIFYAICMIITLICSIGAYKYNKETKRIKADDEDYVVNHSVKYIIGQIDECIGKTR